MAASPGKLFQGLRRPVLWTLLSYGTLGSVDYICAISYSPNQLHIDFYVAKHHSPVL